MGLALPKRDRYFLAAVFAISLLASFLLGFRPKVHPLERGIDASYLFAASYASENGLRWGRDFISTFGPYAYLIYASDLGSVPWKKLASEWTLVVLAAAACTFYLGTAPGLRFPARAALAVLLLYALHLQGNSIYGDEYRWFAVLVLLLLASMHARGALAPAGFFLASVLAGFFVLVKLSLGLGGLLSLGAGSLLFRRPSSKVLLLGAGGSIGFALGWVLHQGTLAGAPSFATAAIPVISGYSSAMSLAPEGWHWTALSFAAFALLLGLWAVLVRAARARATLLACAVPLFIAWKHAMVRQDPLHVSVLVLFGSFFACLLLAETLSAKRPRGALLLAGGLSLLLAPWIASSGPERLAAPFRLRPPEPPAGSLERLRLSEEARSRIGEAPVDVYPWESIYVAANELSWRNRPSPASFATYTPELDERNAGFFASEARPTYLLWHLQPNVHSIDGRHLFWDEPLTLRTLLSSYRLVARESAFLLEQTAEARLSIPSLFGVVEAEWGAWISVPESEGAVLAAVALERPWGALLRKALFRENPAFLSVRFADGEERTWRFVPDQAESGLWVSPLPRDLAELQAILRGNLSRPRVRAIRFEGGWEPEGAFLVSWLRVVPLSES